MCVCVGCARVHGVCTCVCVCMGCACVCMERIHGICVHGMCTIVCTRRVHGVCVCARGVRVCMGRACMCAWNVFMGSACMGCAQLYAPDVRMGCVRVHGMRTVAFRARVGCVCVHGMHTCACRGCAHPCAGLCARSGPAAGRRAALRAPLAARWGMRGGVGTDGALPALCGSGLEQSWTGGGCPAGGDGGLHAGCDPPRICVSPDTCRNSNVICKLTMGSLRFIFNYNVCTNLNSPLFINNAWVCVYRCLINLCLRQLKACKIPKGGGGERLRGSRGSTGRSCGSGGGAAAGQPLQRGGSGEQPRAHRPSAPPPSLPQFPHSPSHLSRCALPARCSPLPPPHPLRPPPWRGRGVRAVGASPALAL